MNRKRWTVGRAAIARERPTRISEKLPAIRRYAYFQFAEKTLNCCETELRERSILRGLALGSIFRVAFPSHAHFAGESVGE